MAMENIGESLGVKPAKHKNEDAVTSTIEHTTAKLPSVSFLAVASGCALASGALYLLGKKDLGLFIGNWVPSVLLLGVYNKIVKANEHIETTASRMS